MPLNATDEALRMAAAEDLAKKLRLERQQTIELRGLFRDMSLDMEAFVAETGQPQDAAIYSDDLRGILAKQGRRVSNEFSGQVTDFLEDEPEDEDNIVALTLIAGVAGLTVPELIEQMRNMIRQQNRAFIATQVTTDTRIITATNNREMVAATQRARGSILEAGNQPTNMDVAKEAAKLFRDRGFSRAPIIAQTYTQKIAEGVKEIESEEFFNTRNGFQAIIAVTPQAEERQLWVTVGDENVRPTHIAVDFTQKEDGGWVVGGEFLRFPGDPNGSPGNIINCRCSAQVVIE